MAGAQARLEREAMGFRALAWNIVNLDRHKRLPTYEKFVKPPAKRDPARKQTAEEIQSVLRGLNHRPQPPRAPRRTRAPKPPDSR